jgi:hypothetical protein
MQKVGTKSGRKIATHPYFVRVSAKKVRRYETNKNYFAFIIHYFCLQLFCKRADCHNGFVESFAL